PITAQEVIGALPSSSLQNLVFAYAGDPSLPMSDLCYKLILEAYDSDGLLSRFLIDPAAIPQGMRQEAVMSIFNRIIGLSHHPEIIAQVAVHYHNGAAPLALAPLMPIAGPYADMERIVVFKKISEKKLVSKHFLSTMPTDPQEQAAHIRKGFLAGKQFLSQ